MNQKSTLRAHANMLRYSSPSDVHSYVASAFSLHNLVHSNSGSGLWLISIWYVIATA